MVAVAHPLAVDAGLGMLDKGGSAVDAAIAVQLVLNLVEPQASGIGGGAFMLHHDARKNATVAYDGRETAPAAATPTLFIGADGKPMRFADAVVGGRSVGVPGVVRMLEVAHARHGKLPWAALFRPAIALAEGGYPLTPRVHIHLASDKILPAQPATRALYYDANGVPKPVGTQLTNPAFAQTLRAIAKGGADAFYLGDIAADMVTAVNSHANAGSLSLADLRDYKPRTREPVCAPYRAKRVCTMPPPGGGVTLLQILQSLERFDLKATKPGSAEALHLFAEAGRLAYADRERYLGDDAFTPVPVAGLLDAGYNRQRSQFITLGKSMGTAEPGSPAGVRVAGATGDALERAGTSHMAIVDRAGNAVSMTTTIESFFGSKLFVRGFFLNNQLTDFSMTPTQAGRPVANSVYPGKRPRSAMSPTLVFNQDGKIQTAVGSPGGSLIINFVAKTLVAQIDWGMDIQAAISLANAGSRNGPTEIEQGSAYEALAPQLKAWGHDVRVIAMTSGLHGVSRAGRGWQGGADPRREGVARGR
jgi:gamma-glutamyltranspeptidase / glutathione hydrolase